MQTLSRRNTLVSLLALAVALFGLTACVYDHFPPPDDGYIDTDGFSLGLTISIDQLASRADDDYDNYIDTENKFRVLFFNAQGQFIFEAVDRTVMPRTTTNGELEWFVHIPVNYIVDSSGRSYDVEALKNQLKEADFKVAILANWPHVDASGSPTDPDKAVPNWGYDDSIFGSNPKNINDLHHLAVDSYYNNTDNNNGTRPSRQDTYSYLMDSEGKMGIKTNWAKCRMLNTDHGYAPLDLTSQEVANDWIRENWDPDPARNNPDNQYRHYTFLQYLWNFSAAYYRSTNYFSSDTKNKDKWLARYGGTTGALYRWLRGYTTTLNDQTDDANLYFANGIGATIVSSGGNIAVRIPNLNTGGGNGTQGADDYQNPRGIRFTAKTSGTLRVTCASSDGVNTRLAVYNPHSKASNSIAEFTSTTPVTIERNFTISDDPEDFYIYCDRGNAAYIYEIEYIRGRYLYDTDREGILPSTDNPIPMYGVQNYQKLGAYWEPGSTFDLSHRRNGDISGYDYKSIFLIRSVAKVELYLHTDYGPPAFVYMRSANRMARSEPVDVQTPTDQIWHAETGAHQNLNSYYGGTCEWYNIWRYGCCYRGDSNTTETNTTTELPGYKNWLSWFYRTWSADAQWLNNGTRGWNFGTGVNIPNTTYAYPRIFNADIERSDFIHMIDAGTENGYYKYVLYLPDKNIDDPNYVGIQASSIPKVAHIEYRYDTRANLDDNECYRIYFTNNRRSELSSTLKTDFESTYEKTQSNLIEHWPIMRNHVYRFYVGGNATRAEGGEGGVVPEVYSEVTTWAGEKLAVE